MANTFTLISTTTVGVGGAASIDFNSIPGTYTDLQILLSGRTTKTNVYSDILVKFNTSTNFANRGLYSDGSTAASWSSTVGYVGMISAANATTNTHGSLSIYIPNYAGSTNKSILSESVAENNATNGMLELMATKWNLTDAVTAISIYADGGFNFAQYSTASLYGILKGSGGATVS